MTEIKATNRERELLNNFVNRACRDAVSHPLLTAVLDEAWILSEPQAKQRATTGDKHAMYVHGLRLFHRGDKIAGLSQIIRSAESGFIVAQQWCVNRFTVSSDICHRALLKTAVEDIEKRGLDLGLRLEPRLPWGPRPKYLPAP